jgi:hypothetical protein
MTEQCRPAVLVTRRIPEAGLVLVRESAVADPWEDDRLPAADEVPADVAPPPADAVPPPADAVPPPAVS